MMMAAPALMFVGITETGLAPYRKITLRFVHTVNPTVSGGIS
jgi:hypothetical protein